MMEPFKKNGLVLYHEIDILKREYVIKLISHSLEHYMNNINKAWKFKRVETSQLIPKEAVSNAYTKEDYYSVGEDLALRPETTWGSYEALRILLHTDKLPLCVWQAGKSFRNEQDKTFSNIRFKEFYQMEFQMAYSEGSKADYYNHALNSIEAIVNTLFPVSIVASDRIPAYAEITMDLNTSSGMEVASISKRTDFDHPIIEVAIGLDRILFNMGLPKDKP